MTLFPHIAVLVIVAAISWFLSAHGTRIVQSGIADIIHRGFKCLITLVLVEAAIWILSWDFGPIGFVVFLFFVVSPLALIWGGPATELLAIVFHWLIDPEDNREFDPEKRTRDLNTVATLMREGRNKEAIQLCQSLKESGDASVMAMDAILEELGIPQKSNGTLKPLNKAAQLRREGRFQEVELILKSMLLKNPADVEAAIMLIRLYAENLRQGDKARQVLELLKKQRHVSAAHLEFATRSIHEWLNPSKGKNTGEKLPESIEELLSQRYFGTAAEMLEQQIKEQPGNFKLHLKLAEIQCLYCNNSASAEKIVRQMEASEHFTREQIQSAKIKLKEWRALPPRK